MISTFAVRCHAFAAAAAVVTAATAAAQARGTVTAGISAGGTFYCIVSRCDAGSAVLGTAGWQLARAVAIDASLGRHYCVDCGEFWMADAGLRLQHTLRTVTPYVGAGAAWSSDPELMGTEVGLYAAVGSWLWPHPRWGLRLELRGRQVGRGDAMGIVSAAVVRRLARE